MGRFHGGKPHSAGGLVALVVLLAGCGVTTPIAASSTPPPTPMSTATATVSPTVTPVPTKSSTASASCSGSTSSIAQATRSGDLLISSVTLGYLAYSSVMLPDGTPTDKPYKLTADSSQAYTADFPNSPATNPGLNEIGAGGYQVTICNTSTSHAHVLQAVSARITGFTPYTGQLNSWLFCDGTLTSHHQPGSGGCGGGFAGCDCFHAAFPGTSAGATVTMTQTQDTLNIPGDHQGKLPFTLSPGKSVTLFLGLDTPPPGTYTFAFGFTFDGASPIYSVNSPKTLLAPVAHKWTGAACQQPALEAQITPTNPETYYICAQ